MFPDLDGWKTFSTEINKSVFDKSARNEAVWKNEWQSFEVHNDVTAIHGLKPRRDL